MEKAIVNPPVLAAPRGFSHSIRVEGARTLVFVAGQTATDADGHMVGPGDMVKQFDQALSNLLAAVEANGGTFQNIVKMTIYVTDGEAYRANLDAIGQVYRSYFGKYFPAMTWVQVASLFQDEAMIEIEGIAVLG